jgi:hypothetical protein
MTDNKKKQWAQPQLTVLGNVESLTLKNKQYGTSDGFLFQGNAISG